MENTAATKRRNEYIHGKIRRDLIPVVSRLASLISLQTEVSE